MYICIVLAYIIIPEIKVLYFVLYNRSHVSIKNQTFLRDKPVAGRYDTSTGASRVSGRGSLSYLVAFVAFLDR